MDLPFELHIALRYLLAKRKQAFISVISFISTLGVTVGVMALVIAWLPAGPRDAVTWLRMILTGTLAGTLLALDNALGLDQTSFLYPVWQAAVAVRLAMALRRRRLS